MHLVPYVQSALVQPPAKWVQKAGSKAHTVCTKGGETGFLRKVAQIVHKEFTKGARTPLPLRTGGVENLGKWTNLARHPVGARGEACKALRGGMLGKGAARGPLVHLAC